MVEARLTERPPPPGEEGAARAAVLFSRREVREFSGWAHSRVHRYLRELAELEYLRVDSGRNGLPFLYRLAWDGQGTDGKRFMPGLRGIESLGLKDVKELQ